MILIEQLIAHYTPSVDIISFIFCSVLMFIVQKVLYFSKDRMFVLFKRALFFIIFGTSSNIAFYFVVTKLSYTIQLIFILRGFYHISFMCSLYCFLLYMKHMIEVERTLETTVTYITRILFFVCIALEVLSPLTKTGLYYKNGQWFDPVLSSFNFFYVYACVLLFLVLIFYSKRIIRYVRTCLVVTEVVVAVIMIFQWITGINTYSSFTYVLPVYVVMILLHSKPFDDRTGALDSASFDSFIKESVKASVSVDYVILKLNISMLDTIPVELGKVLNSFWHDSFKDALSFKLASDAFVLAVPRKKINGNTEEKINYLIYNTLLQNYAKYNIPYKLIGMMDVDFVENLTDILGITQYLLNRMEDNSIMVLNEEQKTAHRIMKQAKENLADIENKNDLDDPRVAVYYQPVRNMKTGEYDTAEALMRLQLDGVGIVMPYMFISMAEEYGYITLLTKILFNKVCKHLKSLEAEGCHLKRVSVNVSALDLKSDGFCEEIIKIIKDTNLDCSKIGIELTESRSDSDFMILKDRMKVLHDAGIALYLDDIGTGYSNLDRILQYDVDVVKFDRFFLLEAEKSMKVIKMMSHLSQAFKDLDYKLLFEGVETEEHEALCMSCGADYIQGFKYSKPVPFEEAKKFFNNTGNTSSNITSSKIMTSGKTDFSYVEMKDQYSILLSMSKLFYSMHVIDLVNNTVRPYNPTEDAKVINVVDSSIGADEMMKQIMRMCTVEEHVDAVLEFTDLKTIADRMINKKILSAEYIGKSIGWYVASFYTIETDQNGRPTKLVFTTRSIDDIKKKEASE